MRRALDEARAELDTLTDRDAILDCYFAQCRRLFHFTALFVVRGDTAYGRNVAGIGAPDDLVSRLSFPLTAPGVLARARDQRRPFIATAARTDADNQLFGSLGRAMPAALVVPLVVRDRVVAVALGERAAEVLEDRAFQAVRHPMELAKEEMLIWSQIVGEALERVILRKKGVGSSMASGAMGSWPPPAGTGGPSGGSWRPPQGAGDSSRPPAGHDDAPEAGSLRLRPPPSFDDAATGEPVADIDGAPEPPSMLAPLRSYFWPFAVGAALLILAAPAAAIWLGRGEADPDRIVLKGEKLTGWPSAVDPLGALEFARAAGGRGELASIRAELTHGHVDFSAPGAAAAPGVTPLSFLFVRKENETELPIDSKGMHAPRVQSRRTCGDDPCHAPVPTPTCTTAQVWDAAKKGGLLDTDRAIVTYAAHPDGPKTKPGWLVAVDGRGDMHVDDATCAPVAGESLLPAALPLSAIGKGAHDVDPLDPVAIARTQSGLGAEAALLDIDARGVDINGRVDLGLADNGITYRFADPPSVPADRRRFRTVKLGIRGMPVATNDAERGGVAARHKTAVIRPPTCSFSHAFKAVGSVPTGTAGHVTFGPDVSSPGAGQWTVEVTAMGLHETIGDDVCAAWEKLPARKPPPRKLD